MSELGSEAERFEGSLSVPVYPRADLRSTGLPRGCSYRAAFEYAGLSRGIPETNAADTPNTSLNASWWAFCCIPANSSVLDKHNEFSLRKAGVGGSSPSCGTTASPQPVPPLLTRLVSRVASIAYVKSAARREDLLLNQA